MPLSGEESSDSSAGGQLLLHCIRKKRKEKSTGFQHKVLTYLQELAESGHSSGDSGESPPPLPPPGLFSSPCLSSSSSSSASSSCSWPSGIYEPVSPVYDWLDDTWETVSLDTSPTSTSEESFLEEETKETDENLYAASSLLWGTSAPIFYTTPDLGMGVSTSTPSPTPWNWTSSSSSDSSSSKDTLLSCSSSSSSSSTQSLFY